MVTGHESRERSDKIRRALRYLIERGELAHGDMQELARHFGVTRERVRQLKEEVKAQWEREQMGIRVRRRPHVVNEGQVGLELVKEG